MKKDERLKERGGSKEEKTKPRRKAHGKGKKEDRRTSQRRQREA